MPRRVGLPGAAELCRTTGDLAREADAARATPRSPAPGRPEPARGAAPDRDADPGSAPARHTGRVRHDEKITVYVSSEELLALEHLRLRLRAEHGIAADRGRIVRAAIASALTQVAEEGPDADVGRRLAPP